HQINVNEHLDVRLVSHPSELTEQHLRAGLAELTDHGEAAFYVAGETVHVRKDDGVGFARLDAPQSLADRWPVEISSRVALVVQQEAVGDSEAELLREPLQFVVLPFDGVIADLLQQTNAADPERDQFMRLRRCHCRHWVRASLSIRFPLSYSL